MGESFKNLNKYKRKICYYLAQEYKMKIYSIIDDMDTAVGFKLSGINSYVSYKKDEIDSKIDEILKNDQIGILVVSKNVYTLGKDKLNDIIEKRKMPLVVVLDR